MNRLLHLSSEAWERSLAVLLRSHFLCSPHLFLFGKSRKFISDKATNYAYFSIQSRIFSRQCRTLHHFAAISNRLSHSVLYRLLGVRDLNKRSD